MNMQANMDLPYAPVRLSADEIERVLRLIWCANGKPDGLIRLYEAEVRFVGKGWDGEWETITDGCITIDPSNITEEAQKLAERSDKGNWFCSSSLCMITRDGTVSEKEFWEPLPTRTVTGIVHCEDDDSRLGENKRLESIRDYLHSLGYLCDFGEPPSHPVYKRRHAKVLDLFGVFSSPIDDIEGLGECSDFFHFGEEYESRPDDIRLDNLLKLIGNSDPEQLARECAIDVCDAMEQLRRLTAVGGDISAFMGMGSGGSKIGGTEEIKFLVDGLIPAGQVVLVAGPRGVGKSTVLHELVIAAGFHGFPKTWLGREVNPPVHSVAVMLAGEDDRVIVDRRSHDIDPDGHASYVYILAFDGRDIEATLDQLRGFPSISLVVIDPARVYLPGDEDSSDVVNRFMSAITQFAREKGCAIIVVHHLKKNANPKSVNQVADQVRGSAVFLDRPRLAFAIYRKSEMTIVGVIKSNLPPSCGLPVGWQEAFIRDEETLRLVPANEDTRDRAVGPGRDDSTALDGAVLAAAAELIKQGRSFTCTGNNGLYYMRHPALKGQSRRKLEKAVRRLVTEGRLVEDGGSIALPPGHDEPGVGPAESEPPAAAEDVPSASDLTAVDSRPATAVSRSQSRLSEVLLRDALTVEHDHPDQ